MLCSKCRRQAVIRQRYSGLHLCRTHFEADFEAKAKRAIRVHRWLSPGDRIGVVLSSEGHSGALLHFLQKLAGRRRDVEILAVVIDEGITGYSDPDFSRYLAEKSGIRHVTASFLEMFGMTFDTIAHAAVTGSPCSSCTMLRALCLERTARDHAITRLALVSNLDDEALRVFQRFLTGDVERLVRHHAYTADGVLCMRPFMYIPEREVALYAAFHGEAGRSEACPHATDGFGADVRNLLKAYDTNHPSARYALVNLGDRLREPGGGEGSGDQDAGLSARWHEHLIGSCRSCRIHDEAGDG